MLSVISFNGWSQTCTGSLGDPIVNVDFGSGNATFGPQLSSDPNASAVPTTNYPYVAGYPTDGYYTIVSNTTVLNHNTWHNTTDHTGTIGGAAGGYMMIVNANAMVTNYFYKQTISELCPGTTYEFAAYVMNLAIDNSRVNPNLTFTITDATGRVTSVPTGDIPYSRSPTWIKEGILFTTPATGGSIILTITNNGPGGNGNDLALDDITFRACGPVVTSSFIASASASLSGCAGDNLSYTMTSNLSGGYQVPAYQWQTNNNGTWIDIAGATSPTYTATFTPAVAGAYQYRMTSAEAGNIASTKCRVVSNVLTVTINTTPSSSITGSTAVCEGEAITLTASGGDSYLWTGPNGFTSTAQQVTIAAAVQANAGDYFITVTKGQCQANGKATVTINPRVVADAGKDITICEGTSTQLQATGGSNYFWSPATGLSNPAIANPIAAPTDTTTYTVTVSNASGCSATANVKVNVIKMPGANAGKDIVMTEGQSVNLNGSVINSTNYYWTPAEYLSNNSSLHPLTSPNSDITYTLHAVTGSPCNFEVTSSVFVRVYKKVVVPNTFTPNGDGNNDTWEITALNTYPTASTQVFTRSGVLVYQSTAYAKSWDGSVNGRPLPAGTYYYKIDLKNGNVMSGWLAIIR